MQKAPPEGTLLDPYSYNSNSFWNPNVQNHGWNPPEQPGFWGSLGKSIGGTLMKTPGVDIARSFIGAAPGRSGLRNVLGGAPKEFGGRFFNALTGSNTFNPWISEAQSQRQTNVPGIGWAAPYGRAMEQSSEYQRALPQYLEKHAPIVAHPWQTISRWGSNAFGSKYPYP
jgi:hypothetical protein